MGIPRLDSSVHAGWFPGVASDAPSERWVDNTFPRRSHLSRRQKNFPVRHWPDGEIEGNVNLTVALKVPFNLGTKQPAVVRLGIGRRTESAGIGTFLNRSG
jgi:hypothetical protein